MPTGIYPRLKKRTLFKKGHIPWNKNLHGKKYLKHYKDIKQIFCGAEKFNEDLICKNCGIKFKKGNFNHFFCHSSCQSQFWRKKNIKKNRNYMKKWLLKNKKEKYKKLIKFNKLHPEYKKANSLSRIIEIPKGEMCAICNNKPAIQKHHEDYNKPLEVLFCCVSCHNKLNIQRRLKINMAGTIILKNAIVREPGYMYYIDSQGSICRATMTHGRKKGTGKAKKINAKTKKPVKKTTSKKKKK